MTDRSRGASNASVLEAAVVEEELSRVEENVAAFRAGRMGPDEFRRFRLNNGVYGIRGEADRHMIRIKCPHGELTSDQIEVVADVTDAFTRTKLAHITTRQAIQIHHIHISDVTTVLRRLNACGLTTREACGNTVRNITKSPFSGFLSDEAFDVTPYAEALFRHLLRNPLNQNLPRKFKIALFGGGAQDLAYTAMHDIGLVAVRRERDGRDEKGFRVYLGGGLGATPRMAMLLEAFTPLEDLFSTTEAVIRIFDRHGDRKDKLHARLKFVVQRMGEDAFKNAVIAERSAVRATRAGGWAWHLPEERSLRAPAVGADVAPVQAVAGFDAWRETNVIHQKQDGYALAIITTPLGDLSVPQMRQIAATARRLNGGALRTMVQQNLLLPWIRHADLPALHCDLADVGLAEDGALRLSDVTRCPGSDTCQLAITRSRGLASAILKLFSNGLRDERANPDLNIKISGCTNSCGQHHIGNIGFYGTYRKSGDRQIPYYQILVGGELREGGGRFGDPIAAVPARRAHEAVARLVALYDQEKAPEERFVQVMVRLGRDRLRQELKPLTVLPTYDAAPDMYNDWDEQKPFRVDVGPGECAS